MAWRYDTWHDTNFNMTDTWKQYYENLLSKNREKFKNMFYTFKTTCINFNKCLNGNKTLKE